MAGVGIVSTATDTLAGLIRVPVGKGCILLLTEGEYLAGLRRGKQLRRREALARRTQKVCVTYATTKQ